MRLVVYCLLFILYVGLALAYLFFSKQQPPLTPWPLLIEKSENTQSPLPACRKDEECPTHTACLHQQCVPKLLRGEHCHSPTGTWQEYTHRGATFAVCACTMPEFYTQSHFGGNCNLPIGCGNHGQYNFASKQCDCDPNYENSHNTCIKARAVHQTREDDADAVSPPSFDAFFHPDYIARWKPVLNTLKRPCSFDLFTGRPLKHARWGSEGCVCDPRYGQFGVRLPNVSYTRGPGYNGCASIFDRDPERPVDVKLYEFYYLGQREKPIAWIAFEDVDLDELVPAVRDYLKASGKQKVASFRIGQEWPYDYGQYVLEAEDVRYTARTRRCPVSVFGTFYCDEDVPVPNYEPLACGDIPHKTVNNRAVRWSNFHSTAYDILYKYPVCHTRRLDGKGRFILNPFQIIHRTSPNLHRFNGLVLHYQPKRDRWMVDMSDYNMDVYFNVPNPNAEKASRY